MTRKNILPFLFLFATLTLGAAPASSAIDVKALAPFVYPDNAPEKPQAMVYEPGDETYLQLCDEGHRIARFDTRTGKEIATVLDVTHTRENSIPAVASFTLSPQGTYLLLATESKAVYCRSKRAQYYTFEIKRNILRPLSSDMTPQQAPLFSPDDKIVAFVCANNIYMRKLAYDSQVAVTTDGASDSIINGVPDWTYEEEFDTSCSMAWSPDGTTLSYLKYDETQVPKFSFSLYDTQCEPYPDYALYPGSFSYKYPVAGEPNSRVTLHSYDVDTRKTKETTFTDSRIEYIPRIAYAPADAEGTQRLMVTTLNRAQNRMELYQVNPKSTVSRSILVEEAQNGWLAPECYEKLTLEPDGLVVMSERTGWRHLYRYAYNGSLLETLTAGEYDVTAYYGRDAAGYRYFQSTALPSAPTATAAPLNRQVSRIAPKTHKIETISPADGTSSASFSPSLAYYTLSHSTAQQTPRYTLHGAKGKELRVLCDNAALAARCASLPRKEFFTFPLADGTLLNGYMLKPAGFDPSRRYPVIMWQYSGPGSQEVLNRWHLDWDDYAAAHEGFLVVCVDPRGTGGRGTAFRNIVYKHLGLYETQDQVAAARHVASLPFVDPSRIGICGWSYGGYETLMCASASPCPFAAAVAIAPVTSWRYYDTVYTERFMLTPQENPDGYSQGSPINQVNNMDLPLLIMHGTADDNVHLSNTIQYVSALESADRTCDMLLFPNKNHSIYGCGARALVFGRMLSFFNRNLKD